MSWPLPGPPGRSPARNGPPPSTSPDNPADQITMAITRSAQACALIAFDSLDGDLWQRRGTLSDDRYGPPVQQHPGLGRLPHSVSRHGDLAAARGIVHLKSAFGSVRTGL